MTRPPSCNWLTVSQPAARWHIEPAIAGFSGTSSRLDLMASRGGLERDTGPLSKTAPGGNKHQPASWDGGTRHTYEMAPWVALADIGTAVGTLVLAVSTFVAVRASVRSTRIAERALLAGQRPVLGPTGPDDPESVQFADGRVFPVSSGQALVHDEAANIYLAIPLHNEGAGLALLRGYRLEGEPGSDVAHDPRGVARHLRGDPPPQAQAFSPQQSAD